MRGLISRAYPLLLLQLYLELHVLQPRDECLREQRIGRHLLLVGELVHLLLLRGGRHGVVDEGREVQVMGVQAVLLMVVGQERAQDFVVVVVKARERRREEGLCVTGPCLWLLTVQIVVWVWRLRRLNRKSGFVFCRDGRSHVHRSSPCVGWCPVWAGWPVAGCRIVLAAVQSCWGCRFGCAHCVHRVGWGGDDPYSYGWDYLTADIPPKRNATKMGPTQRYASLRGRRAWEVFLVLIATLGSDSDSSLNL